MGMYNQTYMTLFLRLFNWGVDIWNNSYNKVMAFVRLTPSKFLGMWNYTVFLSLVDSLRDIGCAMCVFLFLVGVIKQMTDYRQLRNIETVMGLLLRLVLVNALVYGGDKVAEFIVKIGQSIISEIPVSDSPITVNESAFQNADWNAIPQLIFILGLLATVIALFFVLVLAVYMLVIVYGRMFEILTLFAFSPIALSFLSAEITQQYAFGYMKHLFSAVLKGAAILISGFVFSILVDVEVFTTSSTYPVAIYLVYLCNIIFYMLVFVLTVKASDTVIQRVLGG